MSAEATNDGQDEEERQELAWTAHQPTSAITGEFRGLIFSGQLSDREEQTGTNFGVVLGNPDVIEGTLFVNEGKPEGDLVRSTLGDGQKAPTDYRLVDPDDNAAQVREGVLFTKESNGSTYVEGEIEEDEIIVWYNGVAGGRVGRILDFNGLPFAEYKEDGYLLKGLVQVADGWRDVTNRGDLVEAGRAPRVARAPIPREDVFEDQITIQMKRPDTGRYYEVHVFEGDSIDDDAELSMLYDEDADEKIEEAEYNMHLYHGDGWQDRPANVAPSFNIQPDAGGEDSDDPLNVTQRAFVQSTAEALEQYGQAPDTAFNGGIAGLMERHGVDGDADLIEREVYKAASHLDADDL